VVDDAYQKGDWAGKWELEKVRESVFKIKMTNQPRGADRSPSGRYLSAQNSAKDIRDGTSSFAMVIDGGESMEGEWQFEKVRESVYKIKLTNYSEFSQNGRYLSAHTSVPKDKRDYKSGYAIVCDHENDWEGEWELERV
jgi:hypothetical protein